MGDRYPLYGSDSEHSLGPASRSLGTADTIRLHFGTRNESNGVARRVLARHPFACFLRSIGTFDKTCDQIASTKILPALEFFPANGAGGYPMLYPHQQSDQQNQTSCNGGQAEPRLAAIRLSERPLACNLRNF